LQLWDTPGLIEAYDQHRLPDGFAASVQSGLNRDDVEAVVAELEADTGLVCGHDAGGFWWITTDNPQGEWDGWELEHLEDDSWPATAALPEDLYPAAIVTPDEVWHDLEARWDMSDEQAQALRARATELLAQYPTHLAVQVYCHR
jgi:hypothetical protein